MLVPQTHHQVRIQELASLQEVLASDEDVQKKRMGELSWRVTLLQVNEKTLSRRYTLLVENEAALRKVGGVSVCGRRGEWVWYGVVYGGGTSLASCRDELMIHVYLH